jgi:hypothetical protein
MTVRKMYIKEREQQYEKKIIHEIAVHAFFFGNETHP